MNTENKTSAAKRPTLLDIARECGLSRATVARALSGTGYVNAQRRQLIQDTAARLGYRTSAIARALRTHKSATIGVLIADITNPIFPEIVKGIDEAVSLDNYSLFLCNTDEDGHKQRALIRSLLDREVDGLLLISQTLDEETLDLLQAGPPCVFVNRRPDPLFGDYLGPDNALGVTQLLEHLYQRGHRRIAYVAGPAASSTARERRACFIREMARLGCPVPDVFIIDGSYQGESGRAAAAALLQNRPRPTAILASNDFVALEIIAYLHERGLRVPDDISVTGFDDAFKQGAASRYPLCAQYLTTIDQPKRELGRQAGNALLKRMAQPGAPSAITILPTLLILGESTAPAKP